jgi:palmitoyl-protein thioesterase
VFSKLLAEPGISILLQNELSFAGYWKEIYFEQDYLALNEFLADINNERASMNATYKRNLMSLNSALFIDSTADEIIVPHESPKWWFYPWNASLPLQVRPFNETRQFKDDLLGLRTMLNAGAVHFGEIACQHQNVNGESCKLQVWPLTRSFLLQ